MVPVKKNSPSHIPLQSQHCLLPPGSPGKSRTFLIMPPTAVVIVAHRVYPQLPSLLRDLLLLGSSLKVILVDNGSRGSVSQLAAINFPSVLIARSSRNLHYCGGNNIGIRLAWRLGCKYALLLNSDARILDNSFISKLVEYADKHPDCCFCGPLVLQPAADGKYHRQNTTYEFPTFKSIFLSFLNSKSYPFPALASADNRVITVDYLNGVCVLVSLPKVIRVGLLNIKLGGYYEDADWAYRASCFGYQSHFVPFISISHEQNHAEYCDYTLKCFMLRRNLLYFFLLRRDFVSFILYYLFSSMILLCRAFLILLTGRFFAFRAYCYLIFRFAMCFLSLLFDPRARSPWYGPPLGAPYLIRYR
jgi:GT2 family glycosyltransferase